MFSATVRKFAALAAFAFAGIASQASALNTSDSRYLGNINDGIPSSAALEAGYINTLIAQPLSSTNTVGSETYERSANTCGAPCPTAVSTGSVTNESGGNSINLGSGWQYLLAKYDASQAGSYVWYVGGLLGTVTVPTNLGDCGANGCGLSHWALFNPGGNRVAEPGTLAAFALGLFGLALVRRRRNR